MTEKKNQQQVLLFCEDCGEKNFIIIAEAKQKGQEVEFRCLACDYLNTVSLPDSCQKTS